ncbi:WW domain binding protein 1-like [Lingula anatina]|uniref:WW domain binding protein 1-like n=1 Tax=Lingula anatina TaxID=7574 RepID=A0A1S3J5N6_LINAN|nr:WW domain binding protein 1-like [Lingula anatina]|eukprot:XP_013405566.1 WW domain binding protein 1-like [Lingula anatina]
MGSETFKVAIITLFSHSASLIKALDYCPDSDFYCEESHCCGKGKCCTYYYELWWFWLIWVIIAAVSFCCIYQHRRLKRQALQRRRHSRRGNRTINFFQPLFDPDKGLHLPSYEEVQDMPEDPPPYSTSHYLNLPVTTVGTASSPHIQPSSRHTSHGEELVEEVIDESSTASLLDNEVSSYHVDLSSIPPPPYTPIEAQQEDEQGQNSCPRLSPMV